MNKKAIFFLVGICYVLLSLTYAYADKEERYVPYPIIFVPGIGTSNIVNDPKSPATTWDYLISSYKPYFVDIDGTSKYLESLSGVPKKAEEPHLEYVIYDSNREIKDSAEVLAGYIERVLDRYYNEEYKFSMPCNDPKVIIVAHSLGGIVSRYMLTDYEQASYIRNKVAAVFRSQSAILTQSG